ncbi:MAG: GNAT family protein [Hyphomonadaceae bacterium]|nr:GNAT family protein [Hyphomonadaceae bacterium]
MAFLRRESDDWSRRVEGEGVYLRHPEMRDFAEWAAVREESRAFLEPWEPTWPADELTRGAFRYKVRRYSEDIRDGRAYPFFVFRTEDDRLVGGATLSRVQRGVALTCSLGYWVGVGHLRRGYATEAARALVRFAFEDLDLHRVEAACQPDNIASQRVLAKAGFEPEGRARDYLRINGAWRDHLLFARIRDEP